MIYSRYDNAASRLHKNGPLQPAEPDAWWDRPRRWCGMTAAQWGAIALFLLSLAGLINLIAVIGDRA